MSIVRFQMFQDVGGGAATTQSFTLTGPLDIDPGNNFYVIPVSGMVDPYVAGELISVEINVTMDDLSLIGGITVSNPSTTPCLLLAPPNLLSGENIINASFYNQNIESNPFISTGTSPYTGNWIDAYEDEPTNGFDFTFNGDIVNGDWSLIIFSGAEVSYTFNSATLTFAL